WLLSRARRTRPRGRAAGAVVHAGCAGRPAERRDAGRTRHDFAEPSRKHGPLLEHATSPEQSGRRDRRRDCLGEGKSRRDALVARRPGQRELARELLPGRWRDYGGVRANQRRLEDFQGREPRGLARGRGVRADGRDRPVKYFFLYLQATPYEASRVLEDICRIAADQRRPTEAVRSWRGRRDVRIDQQDQSGSRQRRRTERSSV